MQSTILHLAEMIRRMPFLPVTSAGRADSQHNRRYTHMADAPAPGPALPGPASTHDSTADRRLNHAGYPQPYCQVCMDDRYDNKHHADPPVHRQRGALPIGSEEVKHADDNA